MTDTWRVKRCTIIIIIIIIIIIVIILFIGVYVVGCWRGYMSGARCRLAYDPADATATHCLLLQ